MKAESDIGLTPPYKYQVVFSCSVQKVRFWQIRREYSSVRCQLSFRTFEMVNIVVYRRIKIWSTGDIEALLAVGTIIYLK